MSRDKERKLNLYLFSNSISQLGQKDFLEEFFVQNHGIHEVDGVILCLIRDKMELYCLTFKPKALCSINSYVGYNFANTSWLKDRICKFLW